MSENAFRRSPERPGYPSRRASVRFCQLRAQRLFREPGPLDHVDELRVRDLPAARAQTTVGADVNPGRIAEDVDRVQNPVADELGRLDEVAVDVEHAEPEDRLVREVA